MIEVTAGSKYMDIDAYASCIVYAEFLKSCGKNAIATSSTKNYSSSVIKDFLDMKYKVYDSLKQKDAAVILDVSNPKMIDERIINESNILEVIDHHIFYESQDYWKAKNVPLYLEDIGSVCTIVFERIEKNNKLEFLDQDLCKLLIAGILDNTLNLKASITKERDIVAYNKLLKIGRIDNNFNYEYFNKCQSEMIIDIEKAIENDIKIYSNFEMIPYAFGQLLVIDVNKIINNKKLLNYLNQKYKNWIVNIINLDDGKSYIISNNYNILNNIVSILNGKIKNNILILDHFMLRKEIMKKCN